MASPSVKRTTNRVPRPAYWLTQLIGWGSYVGIFLVWNYLGDEPAPGLERLMLLVFITGLGVSHLFRALIVRQGWLEQPLGFVLPRISLAALLIGALAFLFQSILHDLLIREFEPMLALPIVELMVRVVNWTVLLFIWALAYFAYAWFMRNRREEIRILRLETANRENQLGNLRAQMNPHFMFNALNGIRALIDENPEQAKRSITQLSAILRNAMASVKRKVVPLGEEIDIVKAYLALEAMRYEERLRTRFELEPGLERVPVPPMMLQTLVENAVRHGVAKLTEGGELIISAQRGLEGLVLTVRNSGTYEPNVNGSARRSDRSGLGLRNTRKRLEMIYGNKAHIEISNKDGMVVTEVVLPLEQEP